jgi:carboxypeptidase C (cathepsin A)
MDWSGSENFKQASTKSFLVDDKEAGLITSYGSLSFLKVHDAGHMVPMDQPKAALEMLKRWTQGSITDDNSQILKTVTEMPEKSFQS